MPVTAIFSAEHCNGEAAAQAVAQRLGLPLLSGEIIEAAAERYNVRPDKLERAFRGAPSFFNSFTRERERHVAYLRAAVAERLRGDDVLCAGFAGQLVPRNVGHVLHVCLTATRDFRMARAMDSGAFKSRKDAERAIKAFDQDAAQWTDFLHKMPPWDRRLYDIKIPMHQTTPDEAAALICENAARDIVKPTDASRRAWEDFALAAHTAVALVKEGHFDVAPSCANGAVTLTINKHVLILAPLEKELKAIAGAVPGVISVETRVGPDFHKADIYRRQDFDMPKKVLLVDDETEFVQTLSERLQMREFGTAVAHDGEQALSMVADDEPEVMVLDLRMPGIDGIEVLRNIKKTNPQIEVIILTGHGTEKDRELALQLGAFAYLEKPVDIDKLSATMKDAYRKAREGGE